MAECAATPAPGAREIDAAELDSRLRATKPPLLLDVRTVEEQASGMIAGAVSSPLASLADWIRSDASRTAQSTVVYCASGMRSAQAVLQMQAAGVADVRSLRGGVQAWSRRGLPLVAPGGVEPLPALLDVAQRQRYLRQLGLTQIGETGQRKLLDARVLCIGAGGLGSPVSLYLAAAGVGTLGIIDDDSVELSNLNRQIVHDASRIGAPKVHSAAQTLRNLNADCRIEPMQQRLTADNARALMARFDLVVDGSDNLATRYIVNDAAMQAGKTVVYGAAHRFEGQVSVFSGQPCYRCLFPEPPPAELAPSCAEAGVLGVVPGLIGMLQATEALKLLLGIGVSLQGRLLCVDTLSMQFSTLQIAANPRCSSCA